MIGDLGPLLRARQVTAPSPPSTPQPFPPPGLPAPPSPRRASALAPAVRGLKISENQSPLPQDRIFYSFNYFQDLNARLNRDFDAPVDHIKAYREIFGFEKTFNNGKGSFGLVLPLNTLTADSTIEGKILSKPGGTSTALGDLNIFAKYIIEMDPETGSLFSGGLLVTAPTGPSQFAGASYLESVHAAEIQPFVGYIWRRDRFYLHGFAAIDVPTSTSEVTLIFNDIGIGYYLLRRPDPQMFLTAIAPTFETHVSDPLTHRDAFNPKDATGTPDVVNLTSGVNFEFFQRSVLTFGFVTPVTGPRPFNYEWLLLFNFRFGGSRTGRSALPMLGG
jgi:hypothetical protein